LSSFIALDPHAENGGETRPQAFDPAVDLDEQGPRHRYLGQLEHHLAAVAHGPGLA
jgi:hypothetical protein